MAATPKFFKDFNKDTKDLLTKQYTAGKDWKMESKIKPSDRTFILNPGFEAKKSKLRASCDVDYNVKDWNIETKTTFYADGGIKPKLTWKKGNSKVEYTLSNLELKSYPYTSESDFELVGESWCPWVGLALYDKFGPTNYEVGAAGNVFKGLTLGGAVNFDYPMEYKSWSAGARYTQDGYIVNVTTAGLKTFTTGVFAPVNISGLPPLKLAAQVDCGSKKFDATVGLEVPLAGDVFKGKVNSALNINVAWIRKLTDQWTAAITLDVSALALGLSITRE